MNFNVGDIVLIVHHPISEAIGQEVEVLVVRPCFVGLEAWYGLVQANGRKRAAAHSWLRRRGWEEFQGMLGWQPVETEAPV